jgi:hypothetical protein
MEDLNFLPWFIFSHCHHEAIDVAKLQNAAGSRRSWQQAEPPNKVLRLMVGGW